MIKRTPSLQELQTHLKMLSLSGVEHLLISPDKRGTTEQKQSNALAADARTKLLELKQTVSSCTKCQELACSRKNTVFGAGNAKARLVFVGEAPGFDEDRQGLPFVGRAGQLLTKMIEAIHMEREEVFICNVLKCRPPGNRNPSPEEISNCEPYLWEQLKIIQPKLICALGKFAAQLLLKSTATISQLRGEIHERNGFKIICTFHPSYLLRSPAEKKKAWDDLKQVYREVMA